MHNFALCTALLSNQAWQLLRRCTTRYFPSGSIIADSRREADGLMVVTSGKVCRQILERNLTKFDLKKFEISVKKSA